MIIYGHRQRESLRAIGEFECPSCQARREFKHKAVERYFTLFFIPLFRIASMGEYVECQTCFRTYKTDVLNSPGAGAMAGEGAWPSPSRPAIIRPVTPNYAARAGVLAVLGGMLFACGGLLGLLIIAAQLANEAGPADNLAGFFGVLVLCPLPLTLLGIGSLAGGFFTARKHRAQGTASA